MKIHTRATLTSLSGHVGCSKRVSFQFQISVQGYSNQGSKMNLPIRASHDQAAGGRSVNLDWGNGRIEDLLDNPRFISMNKPIEHSEPMSVGHHERHKNRALLLSSSIWIICYSDLPSLIPRNSHIVSSSIRTGWNHFHYHCPRRSVINQHEGFYPICHVRHQRYSSAFC